MTNSDKSGQIVITFEKFLGRFFLTLYTSSNLLCSKTNDNHRNNRFRTFEFEEKAWKSKHLHGEEPLLIVDT